MKVVLDSNILFSALIKNSVTRKIILECEGYFLFPSYIFEELEKHKTELLAKSGLSLKQFNTILGLLLQKVFIVPSDVLLQYREEAYELVKNIDPDDKRLKLQRKIQIINTAEMYSLMF